MTRLHPICLLAILAAIGFLPGCEKATPAASSATVPEAATRSPSGFTTYLRTLTSTAPDDENPVGVDVSSDKGAVAAD